MYRRSPASSPTSHLKMPVSSREPASPSTADTSHNWNGNAENEEAHGSTEGVRSGESASEGDTPFFSTRLIAIAIKLASGRSSRGYGIDNPRIADGSIIRDVTRPREMHRTVWRE